MGPVGGKGRQTPPEGLQTEEQRRPGCLRSSTSADTHRARTLGSVTTWTGGPGPRAVRPLCSHRLYRWDRRQWPRGPKS